MPKRYQWLVHLAILTLFIWVIAGIVWSITGHIFYKPPQPDRRGVTVETPRRRPADRGSYDIIKTRGLFDIQAKGALPSGGVDQDKDRPIAEMGISLKGTITGPEAFARAIIDDKGKQQLYKIGDEIMGARVLAIFRNKVIMEVNGQEQQLVPEEPGGRKAGRAGPAMARAMPERGSNGAMPPADVMQNMEQFLGRARVVPYFKGGEPYGFRISNVDNDSPLYGVGVRSGDVIRSVNGIPVRSPEDAFKAYQQLGDLSSVQVELERGGSSLSVTVPVK